MQYKARNFSNTVWNMTDTILYPVAFLAATPFFLHHLGEKMFGIYMLSFSILFSLQILNFGLGTATLRNVARFFRIGDEKRINETINTNLSFSLILFIICAIVGIAIAALIIYAGLFHIEADLKKYTAICIFIASLVGGLKFSEQIIQFSFKGFERFDVAAWFNISVRIGILLINVLMVWLGHGVITMLLINLSVTVVMLILQVAGLKIIFPDYRFGLHYKKARIREELNFGVWIWLQSFLMIITYQTDRYVVTYIGLETLSYYALTATIFNHIYIMLNSLVPWLFPRVAGMTERNEDAVPLYKTIRASVAAFGILSLSCFYLVRSPLLTLWVGHEKFLKLDQFIPLFTGFEMFFILTIIPTAYLNAGGFERLNFWVNMALAIFTIGAIFICYFVTHSAQGVIAGLIIGSAITIPLMQYWIYRVTGRKNFVNEVFLTSLPSFAGLLLVLSTGWVEQVLCVLLILLTLRFVYFTKGNFDIKWLKH